MNTMMNVLLMLISLVLLVYSAAICHKLHNKVEHNFSRKTFLMVLALIYLFIVGYSVYTCIIINTNLQFNTEHITSVIFFFGAIFVAIVTKTLGNLITILTENTESLKKINHDIKEKNISLQGKTIAHIEVETILKNKSKELEAALSDFYALRLYMEKNDTDGSIKKENEKIKERIERIKKENKII